jgi:hypothetical protein
MNNIQILVKSEFELSYLIFLYYGLQFYYGVGIEVNFTNLLM